MILCVAVTAQSLETLENGKPYKCAQEDVDDAREALKYYAAYADKVYGKTIPVGK